MHSKLCLAQRRSGDLSVRGGLYEVSAKTYEDLGPPVAQRTNRVDGVKTVLPRRLEAKFGLQPVEKVCGRRLTDAHRAVALHVGVATHRQQSRAWLPDIALGQRQVDDLADSGHCVVMLGQAHGPAEHRLIGLAEQVGCLGDLCAGEACGCLNKIPINGRPVCPPVLETAGMPCNELMIKSVPLNQQGAPCLKECQVAIDLDWQVHIRKIGALANASTWRLRVAEVDQASLPQRVY